MFFEVGGGGWGWGSSPLGHDWHDNDFAVRNHRSTSAVVRGSSGRCKWAGKAVTLIHKQHRSAFYWRGFIVKVGSCLLFKVRVISSGSKSRGFSSAAFRLVEQCLTFRLCCIDLTLWTERIWWKGHFWCLEKKLCFLGSCLEVQGVNRVEPIAKISALSISLSLIPVGGSLLQGVSSAQICFGLHVTVYF